MCLIPLILEPTRLSHMGRTDSPDMVAFSFYKIFGYPTGLGGLLVKASAAPQLSNKTYFGGGTVDSILAESRWTKPRKILRRGSKTVRPTSMAFWRLALRLITTKTPLDRGIPAAGMFASCGQI